jgi:hypothetical protein
MEKRSTVLAVYAESLVFESSFGSAEVLTTHLSNEVTKRAQSIPAGDAAALSAGKAKTSGTTKLPTSH